MHQLPVYTHRLQRHLLANTPTLLVHPTTDVTVHYHSEIASTESAISDQELTSVNSLALLTARGRDGSNREASRGAICEPPPVSLSGRLPFNFSR